MYIRHAYPNELYHHGILGQRWGVRRFQNPDGSLTPAGKKRYLKDDGTMTLRGRHDSLKNEALRSAIKTEQMKNSPYSDYKENGFEDTTPNLPGVSNVEKNVKNGANSFYIGTTLQRGSDTNVSMKEMNDAINVIKNNYSSMYGDVKNGYSKNKNASIGLDGKVIIPQKPDNFRIIKSRDGGKLNGEFNCAIKDVDGEIVDDITVTFNPKNGKIIRQTTLSMDSYYYNILAANEHQNMVNTAIRANMDHLNNMNNMNNLNNLNFMNAINMHNF